MTIKQYLLFRREAIDRGLETLVPAPEGPFRDIIEAMRYSLFAGGKRVRPILCLAAGECVSGADTVVEGLLPTACALECIHTYSLIHDDLPAMDDDDLRRGRPTSHMVYGEATAILAGDGLLTLAFELLAQPGSSLAPADRLRIVYLVARAAGAEGMVGGQALDIAGENSDYPFEHLKTIHQSKTGALIGCAVEAGAIGAGATPGQLDCLRAYGAAIGLAFQIVDDLLDATATTEQLGKTARADERRGKATYPAYFGLEKTRDLARDAVEAAKRSLLPLGSRAARLAEIADYVYSRTS